MTVGTESKHHAVSISALAHLLSKIGHFPPLLAKGLDLSGREGFSYFTQYTTDGD
jgi:hypothetical protein